MGRSRVRVWVAVAVAVVVGRERAAGRGELMRAVDLSISGIQRVFRALRWRRWWPRAAAEESAAGEVREEGHGA